MRCVAAGRRAAAAASIRSPYTLGRPRRPGARGGGRPNSAPGRRGRRRRARAAGPPGSARRAYTRRPAAGTAVRGDRPYHLSEILAAWTVDVIGGTRL